MNLTDYLNLVPSANRDQPVFIATLTADLQVPLRVQELLAEMIPLFDLDTPPVGNQLDIIGQWVGISRNVVIPSSGIFFTWDGTASDGWDFGSWAPAGGGADITVLPDDAYLTLIRGKIAANHWDGTTRGLYEVLSVAFPTFTFLIQDYENMSYAIIIVAAMIDSLTLALLTGGYIPLRPEGVRITGYFISPGPVFAWDSPATSLLAGWDTGLWATQI